MKLVSIIIPTYNRLILLKQAVESCLKQVYSNIEIIIVDDGSTDGTETFVKNIKEKTWNQISITYYKQPNSGAPTARNKGIELAKGDYLQFLDSDDLLHPEKIQLQINSIEKEHANIPECCSCYGLLGESFECKKAKRIGVKCNMSNEYILQLCSRIVHGMQTSAPLWKSSFIRSQPGWRTDVSLGDGDDLEYHIRLLTKVNQISFVEKELFLVREHEGERLSVINKNAEKIASTVVAKRIIFETLKTSNRWDEEMQITFLNTLRTTYANVLEYCNATQINEFEKWLKQLASKPKVNLNFLTLLILRKTMGKNMILKTHRLILNFNKR